MTLVRWTIILLPLAALAQSPRFTRGEQEEFLAKAPIVAGSKVPGNLNPLFSYRVTLDDGRKKHYATVEAADGTGPNGRSYRYNLAAYALDKMIGLNMAATAIARIVDGRQTSIMWWVDDVAMDERSRRQQHVEPSDPADWDRQMQAVRVFDELMANEYRSINPEQAMTTSWDNLLISRDWRIWLIDHARTFRTTHTLEDPAGLARCDRQILMLLRKLNRHDFARMLSAYLSPEQLDSLEYRRMLLVQHFDRLIATTGEAAVLYDLPPSHR